MMKRKLFAGILAVAMSMLVLSVPAFASNHAYSFSVTTSNRIAYTAGNPKDDDEQRAYVYTQSGDIMPTDSFWFSVYSNPINDSKYKLTNSIPVTSNSARYVINYTTFVMKGEKKYLQARTDRYNVSVRGYWYS